MVGVQTTASQDVRRNSDEREGWIGQRNEAVKWRLNHDIARRYYESTSPQRHSGQLPQLPTPRLRMPSTHTADEIPRSMRRMKRSQGASPECVAARRNAWHFAGKRNVDTAMHTAAGQELLLESLRITADGDGIRCPPGQARITNACGNLNAKFVIHAVGPYFHPHHPATTDPSRIHPLVPNLRHAVSGADIAAKQTRRGDVAQEHACSSNAAEHAEVPGKRRQGFLHRSAPLCAYARATRCP
eukprot:2439275-Rhodomonas_salina.1